MAEADGFNKRRSDVLSRIDKSRAQGVDKGISKVVGLLNSKKNFYTTSSCAGRILVLKIPVSNRKDRVEWLFSSHDTVKFSDVKKALSGRVPPGKIWLRQDSAILHVCCRELSDAERFLAAVQKVGFKRSGIISSKNGFTVEMASTEKLETLIAERKRVLVSDDYLRILIREANIKLKRTREKIRRLEGEIKSVR